MGNNKEVSLRETVKKVVSVYNKTKSISKTALQTEISTTKVRKILITENLWSSERSEQIRQLHDQGKSSLEIAVILGVNISMVQNYLPYEKGLYDEPNKTGTAIRSEKYRNRNRSYAETIQAREHGKTVDSLSTATKSFAPFAMQLHLELRGSKIESMHSNEAKILTKYAAVKKSISRDVIVPSNLALHQLHYLINMAFGWTNTHLHDFKLPLPLFQALTKGKLLEIAPIFGFYLKFPSSTFSDLFWDDDYDESMSPKTWMRSKYTKQYNYGGFSNYWLENQVEIYDLARNIPILDVSPFRWTVPKKKNTINFEDATLQDLLDAIIFDEGRADALKESLRLSEILSLEPQEIEVARKAALSHNNSSILLYKYYRDRLINEEGSNSQNNRQMEKLINRTEPKEIMPITNTLLYSYDYGDGWQIDISLIEEFGKDNQIVENETAAKVITNGRPICIAKDGLNVIDDCGNLAGYIDMLRTIHEGDKDEAKWMREWARSLGWTGRDVKPKNMI